MVRIGIVGLGFMGRIHFLAAQNLAGAAVTAVCSRDSVKLAGDWRNTRGNFGPEPGHVDLTGVKTYPSYDDLLADPDIDLVNICNPTHLHPEFAIAALRAGKHVLVEKAIALTAADADRMVAAAKAAGRLLMVAHVLPFFPEFRFAADAVRGSKYGKLIAAHFTRVIARPEWSADIADASKTGGPAVDLHVHDTHFIGLVCGMPKAVFSTGVVDANIREAVPLGWYEEQTVNYLTTSYLYGPGGPAVTCSGGAVAAAGRPFAHGFEIYLEHATIAYNSGGLPLTLFTQDGQATQPTFSDGDPLAAFTAELQAAVDGVKAGVEPDLLSGQLARDALVLCHKECESVKTGRVVEV